MPLTAVPLSSTNLAENTQRTVPARLAVLTQAPTAWADSAPNAAMLAATISQIAYVQAVVHSTASTCPLAAALCAAPMARGSRGSQRDSKRHLASTLKLAIRALEGNIRKHLGNPEFS